jgi:rRNA maturation RNase YbeY
LPAAFFISAWNTRPQKLMRADPGERPMVRIKNSQKLIRINQKWIKALGSAILSGSGCQKVELSILLLDDAGIKKLNRTYLKKNRPTDVMSFPQHDHMSRPGGTQLLGDVAISLETARRRAPQSNRRFRGECAVLLIHGILHLLGYDHEVSPRAARQMAARENELLHTIQRQKLV